MNAQYTSIVPKCNRYAYHAWLFLLTFVFTLFTLPPQPDAQIYKWQDEQGKRHFSDKSRIRSTHVKRRSSIRLLITIPCIYTYGTDAVGIRHLPRPFRVGFGRCPHCVAMLHCDRPKSPARSH